MFKDIVIGQYVAADSAIHKMEPRIKIILTLLVIILLFCISTLPSYILVTIFILISVLMCKVPLRYIAKGVRPMLIIFLFTGIFNLFLTPGDYLWQMSFWGLDIGISKEGIYLSIIMIIRLLYLVVVSSILTLTTSPLQLTDGIERLLNPLKRIKVPAHEIAMMMSIAIRFIPTLAEELDKITKAQMARGADFESGNIINRAKALIPLLVPLFVSAFRRADELAVAMESRCYHGGNGRTKMKVTKITSVDIGAFCVFGIFCVAVVFSEIVL